MPLELTDTEPKSHGRLQYLPTVKYNEHVVEEFFKSFVKVSFGSLSHDVEAENKYFHKSYFQYDKLQQQTTLLETPAVNG